MPGLFVAIEGINGSGKTTQSEILAKTLADDGYQVTLAREPGSTRLGEAVRDIVKSTSRLRDHTDDTTAALQRRQGSNAI